MLKIKKKILLLGNTGKMGTALTDILSDKYIVEGKNSCDFDATDFDQVSRVISESKPDILINAVEMLGIDQCEEEPKKALCLNTLLPKLLAEYQKGYRYLLVHFSTDAVFNDEKQDFYVESDTPHPMNMYGLTKYNGDCFVQALATLYYIIRISVLFGETEKRTQFVEKMLQRVKDGQKTLRVSDDIILSPTYSYDVAQKVKELLENKASYGLYHVANDGKASLYDLIKAVIHNLKLDVNVEKASYKDFPFTGKKNTYTPLRSEKIDALRPWESAAKEYCNNIVSSGILRLKNGSI